LRKKKINLEKINFITKKTSQKIKKVNQTVKCYCQFIRMCYLFYKTFSKMTQLTKTQRIEILILIGCWDKTKTGGISS
jgi:hypothetical protein